MQTLCWRVASESIARPRAHLIPRTLLSLSILVRFVLSLSTSHNLFPSRHIIPTPAVRLPLGKAHLWASTTVPGYDERGHHAQASHPSWTPNGGTTLPPGSQKPMVTVSIWLFGRQEPTVTVGIWLFGRQDFFITQKKVSITNHVISPTSRKHNGETSPNHVRQTNDKKSENMIISETKKCRETLVAPPNVAKQSRNAWKKVVTAHILPAGSNEPKETFTI